MPDVLSGGTWSTAVTLVNVGSAPSQAQVDFTDNSGSPLAIPLTLPQNSATSSTTASTLTSPVAANAILIINSHASDAQPTLSGAAKVSANPGVGGFALFTHGTNGMVAVPLETRNAPVYTVAYDNTNASSVSVAIQNPTDNTLIVPVSVYDDSGSLLGTDEMWMMPNSHVSYAVPSYYGITANRRGTIQYTTPAGGQISLLAFRSSAANAISPVPVLANVTTAGGSVSHVAFGGGWKTSVVLVNTGAKNAMAHVKFLDDNGNPLVAPLTFTQTGQSTSAAQIDQPVAANALLLMESTAAPSAALRSGSVQLSTDSPVSGYVVLTYVPSGYEAAASFENRGASAYLLAFDQTAGSATGVAVSNPSLLAATIPVTVRDDAGNLLSSTSLSLPANGHTSFTLANQFPATANKRGVVEFSTPAGGQINVLGILTPPSSAFAILPALTR
jgi:hypothetical protein